MANDTKERMLEAALGIFARDGYAGANIKDMAEAVGLVKSAFYKHYSGKEEIWDCVVEWMSAYYEERFGSRKNPPPIPKSTAELEALTLRQLDFTVHDEKVVMTRKLLMTEQFRDEKIAKLASEHFGEGLEGMFTVIFSGMMENGSLEACDPAMLAFIYTATISSLVHLCDREPEKEAEAFDKAVAFIRHFCETYGRK